MTKDDRKAYALAARRVARVRGIYSRIGEPLSAEIITDLYRHLGKFGALQPRRKKGLRH